MKTPAFTVLTSLLCTIGILAQTSPSEILASYQEKAAPVIKKLNDTLNKQGAAIAAQLVSKGDTNGAQEVSAQLEQKAAGKPVATPHTSLAALFAQYDLARQNGLKPLQQASIAKIDATLKSSAGKELATITELGKVRAEIEGGNVVAREDTSDFPLQWTYHKDPKVGASGVMTFNPKGTYEIEIFGLKNLQTGRWKKTKDATNVFTISPDDNTAYPMTITGSEGVLDIPVVGKRYLKVKAETK